MIDLKIYEKKMELAIEKMSSEFSKIKTGRANPMMLSTITMNYYDVPTPVTQIANITTSGATQLIVKPYDISIIKELTGAINAAGLGVGVSNEGELIRLTIPALTEETRKIFVKKCKEVAEESRIIIRNIRRTANDEIKKSSDYTKDDVKSEQTEVQKLTDKFVFKIDQIEKEKESDLMTI